MRRKSVERDKMQTVSFAHLTEATKEDFELCAADLDEDARGLPDRILAAVKALEGSQGPIQVNRLEHSLQSATHAYNDGREEDYVVAALIHDIGDQLAPFLELSVGSGDQPFTAAGRRVQEPLRDVARRAWIHSPQRRIQSGVGPQPACSPTAPLRGPQARVPDTAHGRTPPFTLAHRDRSGLSHRKGCAPHLGP